MKPTIGVIFGNRDFFPDHLINGARKDIQTLFSEMNIDMVALGENETKLGSVETYEHAKACAALFKQHQEKIDGILVVLPNFGDEKGVADTIKLSGLNVPILVQAYPDDLGAFNLEKRRDSFCGKISVCNNLRQYGYDYSLTSLHTSSPTSASFKLDLEKFLGVCRVVKGLRSARLGAIGARPGGFNTVRYSEKILQAEGISVTTVDFSEILGKAARLSDDSPVIKTKLESLNNLGIAAGVAQMAFPSLDLTMLLVPPYLLLLLLTVLSSDEFVNFAWNSAGVTTGPITVPLVLAMGLGIGANVPGVSDGFGILALASVGPILTVLLMGLIVRRSRKDEINAVTDEIV